MRVGGGDIDLNPIISYPRAETYDGAIPLFFYVKDANGALSLQTDFDFIEIDYSISASLLPIPNYDVRKRIGENVIQDEETSSSSHSSRMRETFLDCYPSLFEEYGIENIESIKDPLAGNSSIPAYFEPKYMELKKANLLLRPYVSGATSEQVGSNPNILKVGSHYGNEFVEHNITSADDEFLSNVIAATARVDDEVTSEFYDASAEVMRPMSSFGKGAEFFVDFTRAIIDAELPELTPHAFAEVLVDGTGFIMSSTVHPLFARSQEIGNEITIRYAGGEGNWKTSTIAEILSGSSVRLSTAVTPLSSAGIYAWIPMTVGAYIGQAFQQSPACAIIGAHLKKIKLLSGVNWQIVREAARATAVKTVGGVFGNHPGHWDKFRGFGKNSS